MTLEVTTDRETGVRSLSPSFRPNPSASALAAEARQRNRAHLASIEEARTYATTAVRTAEPLWVPPPPAKLVVEDEAALRYALADCLAAVAEAREAELAVAGRVSVAVREQGAAVARHAVAVAKAADARAEAAKAMQAWLQSDDTDGRPDSGAVSAAVAVEAAAKIDVEVMETALAGLKVEHETAIAETKKVLREAEGIRDRIVFALACQMAAELIEVDARALELRRTLSDLFRTLPVNTVAPAGVREAMAPKNPPRAVSGPGTTPGEARWIKLRADLMHDAWASLATLDD